MTNLMNTDDLIFDIKMWNLLGYISRTDKEEENGHLDDYDLAVKKVCCCLNVFMFHLFICLSAECE